MSCSHVGRSRSPVALQLLVAATVLAWGDNSSGQIIDELSLGQAQSLRSSIAEALYRVEPTTDGCFEAPNLAQEMRSTFTPGGVQVAGLGWRLGLALEAWGREGALLPVRDTVPVVAGRRVEYRHGGLTEWYVNEARGLEQGFSIRAAPGGLRSARPLLLLLSVDGGHSVEVLPGARDARFTEVDGRAVLHYTGLRAWDAAGRELAASMSAAGQQLTIEVEDEGAVYPLCIDPWITTELAKLTASDAADLDHFGSSVALSGDTALVGAPQNDYAGTDAGAAYLFERDQGGPEAWGEVAKLTASDTSDSDGFGGSVAISGDTAVVGAPGDDHAGGTDAGAAYVFERDQGGPDAWGEVAKLTASDASDSDLFGGAVAISGDTAVVGASSDDHAGGSSAGSAYVLERDQGGPDAWGEVAKLTASDASDSDGFGGAIAISEDTAVVGTPGDDNAGGTDTGAAYLFERDQGGPDAWGEVEKLLAPNGSGFDMFGFSVAISGDTALIGAWADNHHGQVTAGSAHVFERNQGGAEAWGWTLMLFASDYSRRNHFGFSVALSGDTAVIGANGDDHHSGNYHDGSAYVYARDQGGADVWGEVKKLISSDPADSDYFGWSAAVSGDTAVVGSFKDDHAGGTDAGSAYVFPAFFSTVIYCVPGFSANGCQASISSVGTASATAASGFALKASGAEGAGEGIFFFATNGRQANPWGGSGSLQCVVPPVRRAGLLTGLGTAGGCDGSFTQDLNALWCPTCPRPALNPGAGSWVQAQLWYRSPLNTSNPASSLSDAIEFLVGP